MTSGQAVLAPPPSSWWKEDTARPGWRQTADGRWVPATAPTAMPVVGPEPTYKEAPDRRKQATAILAVVVAIALLVLTMSVVASAARAAGRASVGSAPRYPGRADVTSGDRERAVGQSADVAGYRAVVLGAQYVPAPAPDPAATTSTTLGTTDSSTTSTTAPTGYVRVKVVVANLTGEPRSYEQLDWRLEQPNGVVAPAGGAPGGQLGGGDLSAGNTVQGDVWFQVGDQRGDFYVIFKPDPFNAARGVWKVTV